MRASLFLWFHKWQHVCKTNTYVMDCICLTVMSKITVVRKNDWLLWMHTQLRWSYLTMHKFGYSEYMIWYMIYLLTAIGLTTGGSSTLHIYTQTIHRTTINLGRVWTVPRRCELYAWLRSITPRQSRLHCLTVCHLKGKTCVSICHSFCFTFVLYQLWYLTFVALVYFKTQSLLLVELVVRTVVSDWS